jgi:DNA-binding SARP family transcriptional activator
MSGITVRLFGRFSALRDDRVLAGFEPRKLQELCGYLLLRRDRPHSREELATLLWGNGPPAQAKKQLRQTLWQLQCALGEGAEPAEGRVLIAHPEWVTVNSQAPVSLDVALFEHAIVRARGVAGGDLDQESADELRSAADLYRGDFLEGSYEEWCLFERERLQNAYLAVLDKLMDYCDAHQEFENGLAYGEASLRYDRARERTHQRLMCLQYRAGDRAGALRQYERCATALQEELGVAPGRRTLALLERIRADQLDGSRLESAVAATPPIPPTAALADFAAHLRQLRAGIHQLERQLDQSIEFAESALQGSRRKLGD